MNSEKFRELLKQVRSGEIELDEAIHRFRKFPFEDLGYAKIDCHRALRTGVPEVVFCQGKSLSQVQGIVNRIAIDHYNVMATRATREVFEGIQEIYQDCEYHETAQIVVINPRPVEKVGNVVVVSAGTADIPVAEEAVVTAEILGNDVNRIYDVGVAGLHRLLHACDDLFRANVAVVVAGMEGALASVVGGLVSCPVIGVPTSIGYGANFGGVAALLSMLNTCASGVSVVNIDNGFGAGYQASLINHLAVSGSAQESVPQTEQTSKEIRLAKSSR